MSKYIIASSLILLSLTGQVNKMRWGFLPSLDLIKVAMQVTKKA